MLARKITRANLHLLERKDERSKRKTKQGVSKHIKQDKEHMEGRKQKRDEQGRM